MRENRSRGFTLVELLSVIAVLAILGSLLIASISSVRSMAESAECTSNLRNIGMGLRLYSQENDSKLPTSGNYNTVPGVGTGLSWMMALYEFMEQRFPDMNENNILLCPAALDTYPNGNARRTYGMNAAGTGGNIAINPDTFLNPASTVLIMDTAHMSGGDGYYAFGAGSFDAYADWRHDEALNVLFVDGHVESINKADEATLKEYVLNYQNR